MMKCGVVIVLNMCLNMWCIVVWFCILLKGFLKW